jgi:cellular nucleic acid-binding protein
MATIICDTCGGRGHMSYECPSARMFNRGLRRF